MGVLATYRGITTKKLYRFYNQTIPAALIVGGALLEKGTYNGETVILANQDGSVRRGVAGAPVPGDPYSPTAVPSPWEST